MHKSVIFLLTIILLANTRFASCLFNPFTDLDSVGRWGSDHPSAGGDGYDEDDLRTKIQDQEDLIDEKEDEAEDDDDEDVDISLDDIDKLLEKKVTGTETCKTKECLDVAYRLQRSLNESVSPCQDFYQFACGGWLKENPQPDDWDRWGQFNVAFKKLNDKLRELFENPPGNTHSVVKKVVQLYNACINEDARERVGYSGLEELLFKHFRWPLLANENEWNPNDYDWQKHLAFLIREFGSKFMFNPVVYLDAKNTTRYVLYFDSPTFGIGRKQLINPDIDKRVAISAYEKLIFKIVSEIGIRSYKYFTPRKLEIEEMIKFEQSLANITGDPINFRDMFTLYGEGRITPDQFQEKYGFKVLDILKEAFNKTQVTIDGNSDHIVVYDKKYYENFKTVVTGKLDDKLKRTIANYLNWRIVKDLATYTTKDMKTIVFEYLKEVNPEVKKQTPVREQCVDVVNLSMPYATGRLYTDAHFDEQQKQSTLKMIGFIRQAFDQLLDENSWMDEETKKRAKVKLTHMHNEIGYPDLIKDDEKLRHYYSSLSEVDETNYFKSVVMLEAYHVNKSYSQLDSFNLNRSEFRWTKGPAFVNAHFGPQLNRITFPAGILQPPFYQFAAPIEINLGGVGQIIGHEITHSFDDKGSQFDEFGNLYLWWKNATKQQFDKKKVCFVKQYSNFFDPVANMSVNGKLTIGENIADNGGLREAYRALQLYYQNGGQRQLLPGSMSKYTGEQLLFISFAHKWCTHRSKQRLIERLLYSRHAPNNYRVNGPVANSKEFAKTFDCPRGALMNPKKKCVLW